jgi:hypothetical protein
VAEVEGLRQLIRDLQILGVEVDDIKDVFADFASQGARLAAGMAPKRSGRLAASIRGNRAKSRATVSAGSARVPYAGAINYGWPKRNIRGSQFMQKADQVLRPRIETGLQRAVERLIRERGLA